MKKEYLIFKEEVELSSFDEKGKLIKSGKKKLKYFIEYFGGEFHGLKEFYGLSLEQPETEIRNGYSKHVDIL